MRESHLSERITVFALFFGLSLLDAFERRNWPSAGFWLAVAALFLLAGRRPSHRGRGAR